MDSLVQWFTANLSGVISKEAIIFIISMIPILELRGGLLGCVTGTLKRADPAGDPDLYRGKYPADPVYPASDPPCAGVDEEGSVFPWYCVEAGTQSDEQKRAEREI